MLAYFKEIVFTSPHGSESDDVKSEIRDLFLPILVQKFWIIPRILFDDRVDSAEKSDPSKFIDEMSA